MSLRPPKVAGARGLPSAARPADDPLGQTLDQEILAEKFATHGRLVEKLERLLVRLGDERFQIGNQFRAELRVLSGMLAREFAGLLAEEIEVKIRRLS